MESGFLCLEVRFIYGIVHSHGSVIIIGIECLLYDYTTIYQFTIDGHFVDSGV